MAGSDSIKIRVGTSTAAEDADRVLSRVDGVTGAEIALTDDRVAGVGDVRLWVADADGMTFTEQQAVEPRGVAATPNDLDTGLATKQPLDPDLTTIGGLSPADDDLIQRNSGSWANRTPAQVKTSLSLTKTDVGLSNVTNDAQLKASDLDDDTTLAADSSTKVPSQHAVKAAIAAAAAGLLDYKGGIDCSASPNYPAALKGDTYFVTVAGKIGGVSGKSVDIGDMIVANADNAGGGQATVGTSWNLFEHNLVGALLAANNLSDVASASTARTNLGLGSAATHADTDFAPSSGISELAITGLVADLAGKVPTSRQVISGTGLSGGGNLTADRTLAVSYGTTAGTAAQGNDTRLSDARTPTAHATSHAAAGSDPLTLSKSQVGLGNVDNTSDATKNVATAANLSGTPALPNGTTATTQTAADNSTKLATTAYADAAATAGGGVPTSRTLTAGSGLTGGGDLTANRSFAVDFGTGTNQVRHGDDASYTNARTPTAHAATHASGGGDDIAIDMSQVSLLTLSLSLLAPKASPSFTGTVTLPTGLTGIAKLASGVLGTAAAGTDYAAATTGSSALKANGSGGFGTATINDLGAQTADYSAASHKLTSVTDPTGLQDAATKHYVDVQPVAVAHGQVVMSLDPGAIQNDVALTAGVLYIARVYVNEAFTCGAVTFNSDSAGGSLTNVGVGLWAGTAGGALLTSSVNTNGATGLLWAATGDRRVTFSTPQALSANTWYYVGVWCTGTTMPKLLRGASAANSNPGISAAPYRWATANTGLTTTAPSTVGAQTAAAALWAGLGT